MERKKKKKKKKKWRPALPRTQCFDVIGGETHLLFFEPPPSLTPPPHTHIQLQP